MRNARTAWEPYIANKTTPMNARNIVRQLEMGLVRLAMAKSMAQTSVFFFNSGVSGKYTVEKAKTMQDNWVRYVMTLESLANFAVDVNYALPIDNSKETTADDVPSPTM